MQGLLFMGERMELTYVAAGSGRLSFFLREEMKLSAGLMNRLKWQEKILVNGQPEHTDFAVKPGDVIQVQLDEEKPQYPAQQGDLEILYEDAYLLAVNKPAGMLIHPSRCCNTGTLANFVAGYYEKTGQNCAFHPVTRLDRDTFGLVLLAKNSYMHSIMQQTAFVKTYHALVLGGPAAQVGTVDAPIARKALPSLLREVRPQGKPSVTKYEVLERNGKLCKLKLQPITGRTHQLRVHCAYAGFPILGDPQYATEESKAVSVDLGYEYQRLCAKTLEFVHPITGENMLLESTMDV